MQTSSEASQGQNDSCPLLNISHAILGVSNCIEHKIIKCAQISIHLLLVSQFYKKKKRVDQTATKWSVLGFMFLSVTRCHYVLVCGEKVRLPPFCLLANG